MFHLFKRAEVSSVKKFYHTNLIQIHTSFIIKKSEGTIALSSHSSYSILYIIYGYLRY